MVLVRYRLWRRPEKSNSTEIRLYSLCWIYSKWKLQDTDARGGVVPTSTLLPQIQFLAMPIKSIAGATEKEWYFIPGLLTVHFTVVSIYGDCNLIEKQWICTIRKRYFEILECIFPNWLRHIYYWWRRCCRCRRFSTTNKFQWCSNPLTGGNFLIH